MTTKGIGSTAAGALAWETTLQWPPVWEPVRLLLAVEVVEHVGLVLGLVDAVDVEVGLRVAVGVFVVLKVAVPEVVVLQLRVLVGLRLTGDDSSKAGEQSKALESKHVRSILTDQTSTPTFPDAPSCPSREIRWCSHACSHHIVLLPAAAHQH